MGKAWRVVLWLVGLLLVIGLVLLGAAWLTGASPARIVELVFNGRTGLKSWWEAYEQSAQAFWDSARDYLRGLFYTNFK